MQEITTLDALQNALEGAESLGFVPTMGALHAGHMALVERARAENERVVVSIFVNPLQFGAGEDLERYPRQLEADRALLEAAGVDVLYAPTPEEMYPDGFKTSVHVGELGDRLCGASRPGHFDGVTTVVLKLFNQVRPTRAYFGGKDLQQLIIIKKMLHDLNVSIEVIGVPTIREADGLAMSSRNQYLSEQERAIAPKLYQALQQITENIIRGEDVAQIIDKSKENLVSIGFSKVDYLELVDEHSLAPLPVYKPNSRLVVAAFLGKTRLIDNLKLA